MCLECVFSSFSTDSGCTVQLVSTADDNTVQYTETFTRSTSSSSITAGKCISSVISGQYSVTVYDEGSSVVAVTLAGLILLISREVVSVSNCPSPATTSTVCSVSSTPIVTSITHYNCC